MPFNSDFPLNEYADLSHPQLQGITSWWLLNNGAYQANCIAYNMVNGAGHARILVGLNGASSYPYGMCVDFTGSGGHIDVSSCAAGSVTGSSMTAAAWINVGSLAATQNIVTSGLIQSFTTINFAFRVLASGALSLTGHVANVNSTTTPIVINTWLHAAVTNDGVNTVFYVNGLKSGNSVAQVIGSGTDRGAIIGLAQNTPGVYSGPLLGKIADVRLYNIPLPVDTIRDIYLNPFSALTYQEPTWQL